MDSLVRFGTGSVQSRTFIQRNQTEYSDNFANIRQTTTNVPGKDGGISPYGLGRGPSEVGNVRYVTWVKTGEFGGMGQIGYDVSQLRRMASWGMQRLFKLHENGELMWTWASLSSFNSPQVANRVPHLQQLCQMTFQCPDARWYNKPEMVFWNDGFNWDDAELMLPSLKLDQSSVLDGSTVTVTNRGNAPAAAWVRWEGNGSDTFSNPLIERKNQYGEVVDSLLYTKNFAATDVIEIDARTYTVTDESALTRGSGAWLEIPEGDTTLYISGTFAGHALFTIDFWDTWI